jgi:putative transposase
LIGLNRSTYYRQAAGESRLNLELMRRIDEQYLKTPFYGGRRMTVTLNSQGYDINHKRIARLMQVMGIQAIYPRQNLSKPGKGHRIYPYLLRGVAVKQPDQVWSTDITYLPMDKGFMYLVAIIDWYSRYVLAWRLSNTLDTDFCLEALNEALMKSRPDIFNTDQGAQFTAKAFTDRLLEVAVRISMDGKGRALDNIFVERLWRTVKYEDIYLKNYDTVPELEAGLRDYFTFYNEERPHQSLGYQTPGQVYRGMPNPIPQNELILAEYWS